MSAMLADCPACGARLKVANQDLAGKAVKCPKCGARVVLPGPDDSPTGRGPRAAPRYDDEDDRPGRPKSRRKSAGAATARNLIGGAVLIALVAVAAVVWANRQKDKEVADAGMDGAGTPAPPTTGRPRINPPEVKQSNKPATDPLIAKLGYDPSRPDMTIPVGDWPLRAHPRLIDRDFTKQYHGKVIVTEGRIHRINGRESLKADGSWGPVRFTATLVDAGGKLFAPDGRARSVEVYDAEGTDWNWKPYRPGQVMKVVGRAATSDDPATDLSLPKAVVLSVSGDGDPPVTPDELLASVKQDPKAHEPYAPLQKHVTLTGVADSVFAPKSGQRTGVTLRSANARLRCWIDNTVEFAAKLPQPGDTVTLIGRMTALENRVRDQQAIFQGLYVPK